MELTREMLSIEPNPKGTDCTECPFHDGNSCIDNGCNVQLAKELDAEFMPYGGILCFTHKITLKPQP